MIKVMERDDNLDWPDFVNKALVNGMAAQGFVMTYKNLKEWIKEFAPTADVWYTERNGDPIVCVVPGGTPQEELPDTAMNYMAIEWIDPNKDFGTGYQHPKWKMD